MLLSNGEGKRKRKSGKSDQEELELNEKKRTKELRRFCMIEFATEY